MKNSFGASSEFYIYSMTCVKVMHKDGSQIKRYFQISMIIFSSATFNFDCIHEITLKLSIVPAHRC